MTIRHLEYLLILSETLNFTKAAQCVHITQPALSRIISSAELELGFPIFDRTHRTIVLTPAGETFIENIRLALHYYHEGVGNGLRSTNALTQSLRIGYISDAFNSDIRENLSSFRKVHPEVEVILQETLHFEVNRSLLEGALDLAIYTTDLTTLPPDAVYHVLDEHPLYVALPLTHRLANRPGIYPYELEHEFFVEVCYQKSYSRAWNALQTFHQSATFTPTVSRQVSTIPSAMLQVSTGQGVAIITEAVKTYYSNIHNPPVHFIKLFDTKPASRILLWLRQNENDQLPLFVDFFVSHGKEEIHPRTPL